MNDDYELLKHLQLIMYKLSNGIDPTSDMAFSEDTILNNTTLKTAFSKTSDVLAALICNGRKLPSSRFGVSYKVPFHLSQQDIERLQISDAPITVSKLTYVLNEAGNDPNMKKLKATQITFWLTTNGFLQVHESNEGTQYKTPTKTGEKLGISSKLKTNTVGIEYAVNYYSDKAQQFIISNINQITGYSNDDIL